MGVSRPGVFTAMSHTPPGGGGGGLSHRTSTLTHRTSTLTHRTSTLTSSNVYSPNVYCLKMSKNAKFLSKNV